MARVCWVATAVYWCFPDRGGYWGCAGGGAASAHVGIVASVGAQRGAALPRGGCLQSAALAVALHAVAPVWD